MPSALLGVLQSSGPAVRRVTIPLYDFPSQHLHTLGAAPHLEELELFLLESHGGDGAFAHSSLFEDADVDMVADDLLEPLDDDFFHLHGLPESTSSPQASQGTPGVGQSPFPSLRTLGVVGSLTDIADIVRDTTRYLERLHIAVPSIQNENEMTQAMQAIAAFCPRLAFIAIEIFSADNPEWVDLNPLNQRPLEIHTRHPRLRPDFLVWRRGEDGVEETMTLPDHA
jgi:hypothetical protein